MELEIFRALRYFRVIEFTTKKTLNFICKLCYINFFRLKIFKSGLQELLKSFCLNISNN